MRPIKEDRYNIHIDLVRLFCFAFLDYFNPSLREKCGKKTFFKTKQEKAAFHFCSVTFFFLQQDSLTLILFCEFVEDLNVEGELTASGLLVVLQSSECNNRPIHPEQSRSDELCTRLSNSHEEYQFQVESIQISD